METGQQLTPCDPCGRPPGNVCEGCLSGNPPPARLAVLERERAETRAKRSKAMRVELTTALTNLPDGFALLALFRLPGSRPPDPDRVTSSSSPARAPLALDVLDLEDTREKADSDPTRIDYDLDRRAGARRQGVLPTLAAWVRLVDGELWDEGAEHSPPAEVPTVLTECSWLLGHVDWILDQQWADEITADCSAMLWDVQRVTGTQEERAEPLSCQECGWRVEEVVTDGAGWFRCSGCNRAWSRLELHRKAEAKRPKTMAELAVALGITDRTLRTYKAEGLITPVGKRGASDLFDQQQAAEAVSLQNYRKRGDRGRFSA